MPIFDISWNILILSFPKVISMIVMEIMPAALPFVYTALVINTE